MIEWKAYINHIDESTCRIFSHGEKIQLKETDRIVFSVLMDSADFSIHGEPIIIIGDIPLIMTMQEEAEKNYFTFTSNELITSSKSKYFYNFFGESEIILYFENTLKEPIIVTVDILARKENAFIANEMLYFLTENLEEAIAICFSRSKKGADLSGSDEQKFNKIDAIIQAFDYLSNFVHLFLRERKSQIQSDLILSENGAPTGPDSVYWALTNLDKLSPENQDGINIYFNNRGYHYDQLPKEILFEDFDIYENRVINTFIINSINFLKSLKNEYNTQSKASAMEPINDYVRFDHTMEKFSKMVLEVKIKEIDILINRAIELKRVYFKIIPSKIKAFALPRMSSYVKKHAHYREAFYRIEKCYSTNSPDFSNNKLLLGLKNLSIIYEITTLLLLSREIENIFQTQLTIQDFRSHSESTPFGGIDVMRPEGVTNNHFVFSSSEFLIDLLYEAKIYPYSPDSKSGDLIDTSNTKANKFGKHHFCPDFIMKVTSKETGLSFTVILDAKFKDSNTVKEFDMDILTNKYLMNIHSVDENGKIKMSSVDMLIILFAHTKSGTLLRRVAPRHCLTGQYPVFPQSTAIALHTNDVSLLNEHLSAIRRIVTGTVGIESIH